MVTVEIPTALREFTAQNTQLEINASSVIDLISAIDNQYPGIKGHLIADNAILPFINIYVNDEDIRFANGMDTTLNNGDTITILFAVAGG